jgi:N-acetylmuramoyl-L-alanine amidase
MRAAMRPGSICGALALALGIAASAAAADVRVVAIDPGHGGVDHGARSGAGMLEKQLSLSVSLLLAEELRGRGFRVVLTRKRDEFLDLTRRTEIANQAGAEIFLSIHANFSPTRKARGPETYFLSLEASDDEARRVALAENDVFGNAAAVDDGGDVVGEVLGDLIRTDHLRASSDLASRLQHALAGLGVRGRGVKQAPFVVLMGANMPAALLEIGFLSNPADAERLATRAHQRRIARALAEAVAEFAQVLPHPAQSPEGAE